MLSIILQLLIFRHTDETRDDERDKGSLCLGGWPPLKLEQLKVEQLKLPESL